MCGWFNNTRPPFQKHAPPLMPNAFFTRNAAKECAACILSHEREKRAHAPKETAKQTDSTMAKITYQQPAASYVSTWTLSTTSATTTGKGCSPERDNDLLTAKEAAVLLRCTAGALYEAVRRQEIPHYRPFSSRILFRRGDLYKWLESSRVPEADLPY